MDNAEFQRIVEAGEKTDLKALLEAEDEKLPEDIDGEHDASNLVPDAYEFLIECKDEAEQQRFFEKLKVKVTRFVF